MEVKTNEAKRPAAALNPLKFRAAIYIWTVRILAFLIIHTGKARCALFLRIRLLLR